jgi:hypothetical protein
MTDAVETQAAEPVQLSLGDVQSFVQIIDICSKRGAFEGSELEGVGTLRSKVVKFLEANVPAESTEAPGEDGEAPVQSEMDMEPATEDTSDS